MNSLSKRINSGDSNKSATVERIRTVPDTADHLVKETINPSKKEQTSPGNINKLTIHLHYCNLLLVIENVYLTRTNSRDSNKVPVTENDDHGKKLNERRPSTSNKSMRGENNHTISDTNHSTRESTASPGKIN